MDERPNHTEKPTFVKKKKNVHVHKAFVTKTMTKRGVVLELELRPFLINTKKWPKKGTWEQNDSPKSLNLSTGGGGDQKASLVV